MDALACLQRLRVLDRCLVVDPKPNYSQECNQSTPIMQVPMSVRSGKLPLFSWYSFSRTLYCTLDQPRKNNVTIDGVARQNLISHLRVVMAHYHIISTAEMGAGDREFCQKKKIQIADASWCKGSKREVMQAAEGREVNSIDTCV